jgi:glutaredoxin-dependent peroxiredoxin
MALPVGTSAPLFKLRRKTSEGMMDVSLSDHIGKDIVVLMFVPGAFTGVCTDQFCRLSNGTEEIPGAVVLGITVDSAYCQAAWAKQENIKIPLISDFTHSVTQAYDVVLPSLSGMGPASQRAVFVIGLDGIISYTQVTASSGDMIDFEPIKAAVAATS